MRYITWLRKGYKKEDGTKLKFSTCYSYYRGLKKIKQMVYKEDKQNITELSLTDVKALYDRLRADKNFQISDSADIKYRALELYIMFREKNN